LSFEEYKAKLVPKDVFKKQTKNNIRWLQDTYVDFDKYADDDEDVSTNKDIGTSNFAVDWTSTMVSPKNQWACGGCWAFSATGAMESNYYIQKKLSSPISLSEQQLISCSPSPNEACNGGFPNISMRYISQNGQETESNYPFSSYIGTVASCKYNASNATYKNKSYNYCTNLDFYETIKACSLSMWQGYLANGPISVLMEADSIEFQLYIFGTINFSSSQCSSGPDHAVLAVAWGTSGSNQWIKVRNSWGVLWGEGGYFYVNYAPSTYNTCYITGSAFQPTF